jgi:hypothetical protein
MSPSLDAHLKKAGVKLSREHRAFLGDHAASLPVDDDHPPPPRAGAKAKAGAAPVWAKDVSVLFGVNDLVKQLTQKKDDIGFWDRRLNRFAVAIGRCFDGDVLVQVTGGRHVGHIVRISHDDYDDLFARQRKAGQRVDALLDDDLEGTERIARSFNEFYEALLRTFRARKPPGRDVTITRLDYSAQAFAITDEQTYILGARIKSGATWQYRVLRMRPRGKPKAGARADGFWNQQPTMCISTGTVVLAGKKLWVSRDDGKTFAPLPVCLRGTADVLGETGGELLVGAGDLYRLPAP